MRIFDLDNILELVTQDHFSAKMVFNGSGAILFSVRKEHRDQSAPGIRYRDNYQGDALAAMLSPGRIEVRYHKSFSDDRVASVLSDLLTQPELEPISGFGVTYQGRPLTLA